MNPNGKRNMATILAAWLLGSMSVLALPGPARAQSEAADTSKFTADEALAYSQAAIGRQVGEFPFTDADGTPVLLSDYLGRPVVVSFIYTSCAYSCPVITQTLSDAAAVARDALGDDSFSVLTVGFDSAADSPDRMRVFARSQGVDDTGWHFLSGDPLTILQFSETLGFIFYRSAKGFDHLSQVTVIDAGGRIYRQVYGDHFESPLLVEPLKELVFGTAAPFASIGDLIKKVRLFCTIYDPAAERYRFDYSIFIQLIVGTLIVGWMFVFVVRSWWRILRRPADRTIKPVLPPGGDMPRPK